MQLLRLEIYGFKSFANRTELTFSPGITAIVGPNGCGKSNVVDAVRWVLGEQNPRNLRANKMEDLIYAGSENSAHKNFAEVSIVLDNSDKVIPLDYEEITITRRYYRSGDSEYFLNRVPCRLKDIHEVLASSPLGKGTYAIISQGQVEEVINSRPEERRLMFEDAAGIALYKVRKQEALKKLSDTRAHLTRIEDIIHELQSQEEEIRESAARAREYLDFKQQADAIEISLWAGKYHELQNRLEKLEARRQELERSRENCRAQLQAAEAALAVAAGKLQECSDCIAALEKNKAQLAGRKTELEYDMQLARQRQADYQSMIFDAQQQVSRLTAQLEEARGGIARLDAELAACGEKTAVLRDLVQRRNAGLRMLRRLLAAAERYRSNADSRILAVAVQSKEFAAQREKAAATEAELAEQIDSARRELQTREQELAQSKAEIARLEEGRERVRGQLQSLAEREAQLAKDVSLAAKLRYDEANALVRARGALQVLTQKLEMLQTMEEELQGFSAGVRAILRAGGEGKLGGILGAVSQLIQVPNPAHALAVETALGGALQYVICLDDEHCRLAIEMLKRTGQGRATLVPVSAARMRSWGARPERFAQPIVGWGDQLVRCSEQIRPVVSMLLGNVLVAENLSIAAKLATETKYRYKIVTLEGDVVSRGLYTGGSVPKGQPGLMRRKAELDDLSRRCREKEQEIEAFSKRCRAAEQDLAELERKRQQTASLREDAERELYQLEAKIEQARMRCAQARERAEDCRRRLAEQQQKLADIRSVLAGVTSRLRDDEQDLELLQGLRNDLLNLAEKCKEMDSLWTSRQNSLQLTLYSLQNQAEEQGRQRQYLDRQAREIQEQLEAARNEVAAKQEQLAQMQAKMEQSHHALAELVQGLESVAASLDGQMNIRAGLQSDIADINKRITALKEELEATNAAWHETDLRFTRWQTEAEAMVRELAAQFGKTPEEGLASLDSRYSLGELSSRLKKLRGRMEELGEVNLAAIAQHQKLVQRLQFLTEQKQDLLQAEGDIMHLVEELDSTIRTLFMETFEEVQGHFRRIFQTLFEGGSAYLALESGADLLETGIEIFARPPGKKTQALSLLSGGEKSMTAIALLFALQSARPSPFCILDEVEAALDDVNILRFNKYLQELAQTMQFILITHRRETMEHADSLYGITISGQGWSQPVSLALKKEA